MTVKLVMLKSGEDVIADVKEIKSNEEVIGYFFHDPLLHNHQKFYVMLFLDNRG